jgi:hypothetical protein
MTARVKPYRERETVFTYSRSERFFKNHLEIEFEFLVNHPLYTKKKKKKKKNQILITKLKKPKKKNYIKLLLFINKTCLTSVYTEFTRVRICHIPFKTKGSL